MTRICGTSRNTNCYVLYFACIPFPLAKLTHVIRDDGTRELIPVTYSNIFAPFTGKYAALWPFLGICAEVVVLCVIILIYEKKRDKTELEESDTDQGPET